MPRPLVGASRWVGRAVAWGMPAPRALALPLALVPLACLAAAPLAGCPLLWADATERVTPSRDLALPSALPGPDAYPAVAARWRRTVRVGLGGEVELLLRDPSVVAAEVARDAGVAGWDALARQEGLRQAWNLAFGVGQDRFVVDFEGRFDRQFQATGGVLDPSSWRFSLVSGESRFEPLSVVLLQRPRAPVGSHWTGAMRLAFPWRDPRSLGLLLGGLGPTLKLRMRHSSGSGEAEWRFRSPFSP